MPTMTKAEIRDRVLVLSGYSGTSIMEQARAFANVCIDQALAKVLEDASWVRADREAEVSLGIDQEWIDYPTGATPGNVFQIGVWLEDEKQYIPMERRFQSVSHNTDPLNVLGGADDEAARAQPEQWEESADSSTGRPMMKVWPAADKAYTLLVRFRVSPSPSDTEPIFWVDGALVASYALMLFNLDRNPDKSRFYSAEYERSLRNLRAMQHTGQGIAVAGHHMVIGKDRRGQGLPNVRGPIPNWDTRPTIR